MDNQTTYVIIGAAVVGVLFLVVLFKAMWRVAEPNEALIISGLRHKAGTTTEQSLGFRIVTGKGTLVVPGVQTVRRLSLDLRQAELGIECVTHQGIPLGVRGVVIYKVGDDFSSIANSARRFLDQQAQMDHRVHNVFAGHLRAIVGSMTVEEMIRDREKLTELTRASSGVEMEKLGLIVDSLQIQEIEDPSGYIRNLAAPHTASVQREARIAQAGADREATEAEQVAEAQKALARRDTSIKQAGYQAEVDQATALAQQAGPLSEAQAHQEVVVQQTKVAELEAQREEQRLQATVRKPADAQAYHQVTLAKAERDARVAAAEARRQEVELDAAANAHKVKLTAEAHAEEVKVAAAADAQHVKVRAEAEAEATRAVGQAEADARQAKGAADATAVRAAGMAEADSIKARADALAQNQDAVIGQELAKQWPAIVEAAAKPFGAVDQLIVLNGAQGLSEVLAQALSQGATGLKMARGLLSNSGLSGDEAAVESNGHVEVPAATTAPEADTAE
ncbi:MAG TPA: SPFH domain-containing protein [Acidimicrobiales bacterium]